MQAARPLVTEFLRRRRLRYCLAPDGRGADLTLSGPAGDWLLFVRWGADGGDLVQFTSQLAFRVPPARRAAFGLALHELNEALTRAKVTFSPSCGTTGLRSAISLLRGASPEASLETGFDEHCTLVSSLLSPLAAAAFGNGCPRRTVGILIGCPPPAAPDHPACAGRN